LHFTLPEETNSDKTPLTGQNTLGNLNRQPKNQVLKDQLEKGWPNGLAHLPPIIAKQLTLKTTFSTKWPPQTRPEGGQVEPVLGCVLLISVSSYLLCIFGTGP
jgi:hypothetical protein